MTEEIPTLFLRMPDGEEPPSAHAEGDAVLLMVRIYLPDRTWRSYRIATPHADAFEMSNALRQVVHLPPTDPDDLTRTSELPVVIEEPEDS